MPDVPGVTFERILRVWSDGVIVEVTQPPDRIGRILVPMSVKASLKKARGHLWRGIVRKWGPAAEFDDGSKPVEGMAVFVASIAKDCPSFQSEDGETDYILIRDEDVQAAEVAVPVVAEEVPA